MTASAQGPAPREGVEQVVEAFLVPFGNRDVPGFLEFFTDDATMFFPASALGAPSVQVQGRALIGQEFDALYRRMGIVPEVRSEPVRPQGLMVQSFERLAVVTFHLGTDSLRSRRTFVFNRMGDKWKIVHVHASDFVF